MDTACRVVAELSPSDEPGSIQTRRVRISRTNRIRLALPSTLNRTSWRLIQLIRRALWREKSREHWAILCRSFLDIFEIRPAAGHPRAHREDAEVLLGRPSISSDQRPGVPLGQRAEPRTAHVCTDRTPAATRTSRRARPVAQVQRELKICPRTWKTLYKLWKVFRPPSLFRFSPAC